MELKYSQVAQLTNLSNEKMVNIIKEKLAESENAAASLVFDDKIFVLDEANEQFYVADYNVSDRALNLSNWEKVDIQADNDKKFEELAEEYFDINNDAEIRVKDIVESFKLKFSNEPYKRLLNKTSLEKKSIVESSPKIKALKELREARKSVQDDISEVVEDQKISTLNSLIKENSPIQNTVSSIDFQSPLSVALFEEDSDRVISLSEKKKKTVNSKNVKQKVKNLWTSESFKEDFKEMVESLNEGEAEDTIENFIDNHREVLILKEDELEDLVLKTTLMIGESKVSDKLTTLFSEYYNLPKIQEARKDYLSRNMIVEAEGEGDAGGGEFDFEVEEEPEEKPKEKEADKKEADKKEKETTIDEDSINKIIKVLNKMKENLKEKTLEMKYVDSFIQALEDAKVGSMKEGKLKEILDFLSSVYETAKEKKAAEKEE
jgi:hypothetical protein